MCRCNPKNAGSFPALWSGTSKFDESPVAEAACAPEPSWDENEEEKDEDYDERPSAEDEKYVGYIFIKFVLFVVCVCFKIVYFLF